MADPNNVRRVKLPSWGWLDDLGRDVRRAIRGSPTGRWPMCGQAKQVRLDSRSHWSCQPCRIWFQTRSAASANVGMLLRRRFSASGSPPARARRACVGGP